MNDALDGGERRKSSPAPWLTSVMLEATWAVPCAA